MFMMVPSIRGGVRWPARADGIAVASPSKRVRFGLLVDGKDFRRLETREKDGIAECIVPATRTMGRAREIVRGAASLC
jgi:hypothetical protein